jgi:hypothetical protein
MTVSQQTPVSNCWGNNSATEFSFDFYIAKESELLVEHTDLNGIKSTLENGVDYSIHEVGNKDGSYITFPLSGSKYKTLAWNTSTDQKELLTISLTLPIEQKAEYEDSGDLSKKNLELSFDYVIRLIQILNRTISRAVKVNEGDEVTPDQLIESLNESKRIAVDAATTATTQAENAQNSANIASEKANIATAKTAEVTETYNNAMADIQKDWQDAVNEIEEKRTTAESSITELKTSAELTITNGMADITANKEQSMSAINENRETSLAEIESAKSGAVSSINTTKDNAVSTVKQTGTDEYNKILSTGIDSKLGENLITNCLKEIPQRIKYTLVDGVLTILKGSVCIVPYGTKDKTADLPKGATFINENFKVYDTQYIEDSEGKGKFFVWAESVNDISDSYIISDTLTRIMFIAIKTNSLQGAINSVSSNTPSANMYTIVYNLSTNFAGCTHEDSTIDYSEVPSLPIMLAVANGKTPYGSIPQVFNGMGVIGSTIWTDKGVKGLVSIDRNEADGTLINKEVVIDKLNIITLGDYTAPAATLAYLSEKLWDNQLDYVPNDIIYEQNTKPSIASNYRWYDTINAKWYINDTGATVSKYSPWLKLADMSYVNGKITSFTPKLPFRAVDENDIDGRWVRQSLHIINGETVFPLGSKQYRDYDISNYLPNDGHIYELAVEILAFSGSSTNATSHWWVSDILSVYQTCSCGGRAYSNARDQQYANGIIPMANRTLRLYCSSSGTAPTISVLRLCGYRKVR